MKTTLRLCAACFAFAPIAAAAGPGGPPGDDTTPPPPPPVQSAHTAIACDWVAETDGWGRLDVRGGRFNTGPVSRILLCPLSWDTRIEGIHDLSHVTARVWDNHPSASVRVRLCYRSLGQAPVCGPLALSGNSSPQQSAFYEYVTAQPPTGFFGPATAAYLNIEVPARYSSRVGSYSSGVDGFVLYE